MDKPRFLSIVAGENKLLEPVRAGPYMESLRF